MFAAERARSLMGFPAEPPCRIKSAAEKVVGDPPSATSPFILPVVVNEEGEDSLLVLLFLLAGESRTDFDVGDGVDDDEILEGIVE